MTSSCSICGSPNIRPWLKGCRDYYLGANVTVDYGQCQSCGLVQQTPLPNVTSSFYPDYPMHNPRSRLTALARAIFHHQIYYHATPLLKNIRLLDFGCGEGLFIQSVRMKAQAVFGYEPDQSIALDVARRHDVRVYHQHQAMVSELGGSLDLVTAHFVLEHVLNLNQTFETIAKVLKRDGQLHAVVPNIRSWEARLFGRRWHGLDAPRHISFPDQTSLRILGDRHGLELIGERNAAFPNTLAAIVSFCLLGRYHPLVYFGSMPIAMALAALFPHGAKAFTFKKTMSSPLS